MMIKDIIIHPKRDMNVCTKFYNNPYCNNDTETVKNRRKSVNIQIGVMKNELSKDIFSFTSTKKKMHCFAKFIKD